MLNKKLTKEFSLFSRSLFVRLFSSGNSFDLENLKHHRWHPYDASHKSSVKTHKSNAEQNIHKIPIIEVEADVVRCMQIQGGVDIGYGHPQVYIQLNNRDLTKPAVCKWCGLRYIKKHHGEEDAHHQL